MATQQIFPSLRSRSRLSNNLRRSCMSPHLSTVPTVWTSQRNYSDSQSKESRDTRYPRSKSSANANADPGEVPRFSMRDLGASPTVKVIVYTTIGIIATLETYAYGRWAWYKWGPKADGPEQVSEE